MFSYRSKGLLNLYVLCSTALVTGFFLLFAVATPYIKSLELAPQVNLLFFALLVVLGMALSGRYLPAVSAKFYDMAWHECAWLATRQTLTMALVLFAAIVATKDRSMSRVFLGLFLGATWVLLVILNRKLPRYLGAMAFSGGNRLPTLFVGRGKDLHRLSKWVKQQQHLGILPVGHLSDDGPNGAQESLGRCWGAAAELPKAIQELKAAQVILAQVPEKSEELKSVISTCQEAGCRLLIHDNVSERMPIEMTPLVEEGQFFYTLQTEPLEDPFNRAVKRVFDIAVSLPIVVLVLPPLCLVVKIMQGLQAPGPLFFVRPRGGRMRSEFGMLKFRSMYHQAPDVKQEAVQAKVADGRIFKFGQFLRRTSLDEFPQFWNVLTGEMSVVGPRPHLPSHDYEFSRIATLYRTRHLVKPGITGMAQVKGYRGEITDQLMLQHRVNWDLFYVTHWSIWLDLQITVKTVWVVLFPPATAR